MWSEKLGIDDFKESDEAMIVELDSMLQKVETDRLFSLGYYPT